MSIDRSPHDVFEPLATPELFELISTLIRKSGRCALATPGEGGGVFGAIVRVAQTADGAPMFALPRDQEHSPRLLRLLSDGRVGLLVADVTSASPASKRVRVTLVGIASPSRSPSHDASTMAFRLQLERIRFASPERSAWYRVAIHAHGVH